MMKHYKDVIYNRLYAFADNKLVHILLFVLFYIFLEFEYYNFINIPLFRERMGFDYEFHIWRFIIAKVFFAASLYLVSRLKGFDYFVNSLFLIFLTIPSFVFFEFMPNTPVIISLFLILFHAIYFGLSLFDFTVKSKKMLVNKKHRVGLIFIMTVLLVIPFIYSYGFNFNLNAFISDKIYEIRELGTSKLNVITAYSYGWLVRIIIPIGIIMSIRNKRWLLLALFLLIQIYLYSLLAQKLVFVTIFIVVIMFIRSYYRQTAWVLFSVLSVILISKLISITTGNIMIESIVVRRTFFIPTIITNHYFEFFNGQHTYLSNSILRSFVDYPFELPPNLLIGKEYFDGVIKSANSGFISDGYMSFGYIGVLMNIIGVAVVFKVFSSLNISSDYSGVIIVIISTLVNGFFLTSLLTHGIIIMLILSFFVLRNSNNIQPKCS